MPPCCFCVSAYCAEVQRPLPHAYCRFRLWLDCFLWAAICASTAVVWRWFTSFERTARTTLSRSAASGAPAAS